jgi:hypothetical protein
MAQSSDDMKGKTLALERIFRHKCRKTPVDASVFVLHKAPLFQPRLATRQRGVVLLLIVLTLLAVAGVALMGAVAEGQRQRSVGSVTELAATADLKQAIYGYILSAPIGSIYTRPGALPMPDTLANGAYDGLHEAQCLSSTGGGTGSATVNSTEQRCLGRWPWRTIPIDLTAAARDTSGNLVSNDPTGAVPWIAISANLSYLDGCLQKLNSDVLNRTFTSFSCASATALPQPWLTVVGADGQTLTNRAAVVIITPGAVLTREDGHAQTRASTAAPGNPRDYLDRVALPLGCTTGCTGTFDNAGLSNTFVQLAPDTRYPANAPNTQLSGLVPFNDVVSYITIEELMPYIERRVLVEMKAALRTFQTTTALSSYPWPATYATPSNDSAFISNPGTIVGMFPFFPVSPGTAPTGYPTTLTWSASALQTSPSTLRVCRQVRTGPTRWANIAQGVTGDASARTGTITTATARWRGAATVYFTGTGNSSSFSRTFTLSTSQTNCNNGIAAGTTNSGTYTVTRTVSFSITGDPACNSAPTLTYANGSMSQYHRYTWACNRLTSPIVAFPMQINDSVASPVAASASYNVYPGNTASVTLSNMRYQPLMAAWYYDNDWYKTSFYAIGNSSAPASTTNCSSATTLTVGTTTGINAVVLQAGKSLTNATRPSLPVSDYLEGANATAASNCVFDAINKPTTTNFNDQTVVVAP